MLQFADIAINNPQWDRLPNAQATKEAIKALTIQKTSKDLESRTNLVEHGGEQVNFVNC